MSMHCGGKFVHFIIRTRDMVSGGRRERYAPNILKIARKVVRRKPCWKRFGKSIFWDLFVLVTIISQLVKTPLPQQKVSQQITDWKRLIKLL